MSVRDIPAPDGKAVAVLSLTPALAVKTFFSIALSVAAFHYLGSGKKNNDIQKMIIGLLLGLASLFIFF